MEVSEYVHQELAKLIPASVLNEVTCFVFYDNHPCDTNRSRIDVTVCTKNGQLKEYFQRDLLFSFNIECPSPPTEIQICRNSKSELYYLVVTKYDLFIVSRYHEKVLKRISNVEKYYFDDSLVSGKCYLKVIRSDDAVPVTYDENFDTIEDTVVFSETYTEETAPILIELKRKLTEARYGYKCNEKTLGDYRKLRQQAALANFCYNDNQKNYIGALRATKSPCINSCNGRIILAVLVRNECDESIQSVQILLQSRCQSSMVYTTKLFEKLSTFPYWMETNIVSPNSESTVACVINMDEIKHIVTSRIDLNCCISYKIGSKDYLLPLEDISISSLETMGDSFDALNSDQSDQHTIIAVLASTTKTEIQFIHVREQDEESISLIDAFCNHLHMDRINDNGILYRKSPYHMLNGVMMIFSTRKDDSFPVSVYTRSPSQLLALIHIIQDVIPYKIIAVPSNTQSTESRPKENYKQYATSTVTRSKVILDYLDNSMIKMGKSKDPSITSRIGTQIDLFAGGLERFKEFKTNLEEETKKGINLFHSDCDVEAMVID